MKQLDLFAGIGGISLAAEWAGIETVAFCEKEPFAQTILNKRFPGRPIYSDIFDLTKEVLERDGITGIDIVAGGFPCQPFSHAGKRTGTTDDRYLWPEMCRVIGELRPTWVFAENVDGLVSMAQSGGGIVMEDETTICIEAKMVIETIRKDLENLGYQSIPVVIPACGVGASHRRYRILILGYTEYAGSHGAEVRGSVVSSGNNEQSRTDKASESQGTRRENNEALDNSECSGCSGDSRRRSEPEPKDGYSGNQKRIVADTTSAGLEGSTRSSICRACGGSTCGSEILADSECFRQSGQGQSIESSNTAQNRDGQASGAFDVRIESERTTESGLGRDFDELPRGMDGAGLNGQKDATNTGKTLSSLRSQTGEEAIQTVLGGHGDIPQKEVLQPDVHGIGEYKRRTGFVSVEEKSGQTTGDGMRDVFYGRGSTGAPSGRESYEQRTRERHDPLRFLSHEMALGSRKDNPKMGELYPIDDWLDGWGMNPLDALINFIASYPQPALMGQEQHDWEPPRVATGVKNRASRLKALGNAVDPLQALPVLYGIRVLHDQMRK